MGSSESAKSERTDRGRPSPWRGPWPAVVLAALCYANTIPNDFTYDDLALVKVARAERFKELFWTDWWKLASAPDDLNPKRDRLYRPLTLLTFAAQHALHGLHPAGYHVGNVLLHVVATFLVWSLARRLIYPPEAGRTARDDALAALAAAVFAVHPIHVEAVANIVGRAEIMSAIGMLAGLLVLTRPGTAPGAGRALRAAPWFLMALLSKENAVCYPAIAVLALLARPPTGRPGGRRWIALLAILVLPLLVYFPLRYMALERHLFRAQPAELVMNPAATAEGMQCLLMPLTILGHYTRLLIVPARLSCDYGLAILDPEHGVTGMTVLGAAATIGLLGGLAGWRSRASDPAPPAARLAAILCTMFLASYALISNTVLRIGVSLGERLMYWPSVPALLLLAVGLGAAWRRWVEPGGLLAHRARLLRGLGALLALALAVRTVVRNGDWANNLELFGTDVRTYPQGAHLHKAYAFELLTSWSNAAPEDRPGLLLLAREHLDRSLEIYAGGAEALAVRASVRAQMGDREGAMTDIEAALQLDPQLRVGHQIHAKLLFGNEVEAQVAELRAQVTSRPTDAVARRELGELLLRLGRCPPARKELEEAVALAPQDVAAWRALAKVLALTDTRDRAVAAFQRVLQLAPDDWEAHANLVTLLAQRDPRATLEHAQRAYALQPGEPRNAINLAEAYAINGRTAQAIAMLQAVEQGLAPDSPLRAVVAQRLAYLRQR
ncbi:MAG: tetratricopeptide repeat protein [Planctomycetota bacterium]